jgi:hypothetical protein
MSRKPCSHIKQVNLDAEANTKGCDSCDCGHIGCCDSSKNKHATKHFKATEHPIIKSFEPGED